MPRVVKLKRCQCCGRLQTGSQQGEGNPSAVLTEKDVIRIRKLVAKGITDMAIAREYVIGRTTVQSIRRGKTWKHLL